MIKDGKTWYWCTWHKCWGTHLAADCDARKRHEAEKEDKATDTSHPTPRKGKKDKRSKDKALSLAKALIAMTQSADGQESISDSDSS
jgi:hypothetical protein